MLGGRKSECFKISIELNAEAVDFVEGDMVINPLYPRFRMLSKSPTGIEMSRRASWDEGDKLPTFKTADTS